MNKKIITDLEIAKYHLVNASRQMQDIKQKNRIKRIIKRIDLICGLV